MAKFKRVVESEALPDYMANRFAGAQQAVDHFAGLESSKDERQQKIARESASYRREKRILADENTGWQTQRESERYDQPVFSNITNESYREADVLGSAIRRVCSTSEQDTGPRANPAEFELKTRNEWATEYEIRGASIFNPDVLEYQDRLMNAMQRDGGMDEHYMSPEARREAALAAREEAYDRTQYKPIIRDMQKIALRSPLMLNKAAQGVTRVGHENVVAGSFGLPDYKSLLNAERERHERLQASKEATASIRRSNHRTSEQKHQEWEGSVDLSAKSFQQDTDQGWISNYMKSIRV